MHLIITRTRAVKAGQVDITDVPAHR